MYPHIIIAFNIERHTMYGKLIIDGFTDERYDHIFVDDKTITNDEDDDDDDIDADETQIDAKYDAGKDFMDNYLTGDVLSLGSKWFNLPDMAVLHEEFKQSFKIKPKRRLSIKRFIKYFIDEIKI